MDVWMCAAICVLALVERRIPRAFRLRPFLPTPKLWIFIVGGPVFLFLFFILFGIPGPADAPLRYRREFGIAVAMGVEDTATEETGDTRFNKRNCFRIQKRIRLS